jgi:Family of unknown function (DUF5947)
MSRLAAIAQREPPPAAAGERCDLCAEPLPEEHRHLLDLETGELLCGCRGCMLLMGREGAGAGRYRTIPQRRLELPDLVFDAGTWAALGIPVDMAFFSHSTRAGRMRVLYPGPMGVTEARLHDGAWTTLCDDNPALHTLEPDVEALLVQRAGGAREHWILPLDDCFRLVGIVRMHWRGLTGGADVWHEIERFFDDLKERS